MTTRKRPLGRGLDALIGSSARRRDSLSQADSDTPSPAQAPPESQSVEERLERLPLRQLTRGKYQPRRDIQPEALEELADSIRAQGVMQPIVVRQIGAERYEIIAGERRWRASQLAELDTIPAVIREVSDEVALALALRKFYGLDDDTIEYFLEHVRADIEHTDASSSLLDKYVLSGIEIARARRASAVTLWAWREMHEGILRILRRKYDF